ncbi:UDP-glycosyltransferase 75C1 [Linum perenne]
MAASVSQSQSKQQQPHVVVVAFPAQGHLNPALHFSIRLLLLRCHVTIITTVSGNHLISKSTTNSLPTGLSIATFSDGYDVPGSSSKSKDDLGKQWIQMNTNGSLFLRDFILSNAVASVVYTPLLCWVEEVGRHHKLPTTLLWIQPATVFDIYYYLFNGYEDLLDKLNDPSYRMELPGISASFTSKEIPSFVAPSNPYPMLHKAMKEQVKVLLNKSSKVLVNTFEELELEAMNAEDVKLDMIGVGPLIPSSFMESSNKNEAHDCVVCRGGSRMDQDTRTQSTKLLDQSTYTYKNIHSSVAPDPGVGCAAAWGTPLPDSPLIAWLETQAKSSVVYVSFGTMAVVSKRQKEEVGKGLLSSKRPFLWVIRREGGVEEEERMEMEQWREEMERKAESVGGRIVEWCSQVEVLSHEAVGCFVTHCGWNSLLESTCLGVPVVAFPQFSDQMTNAKLVQDVWRTGVRVVVPEIDDDVTSTGTIVVDGDEIRRCLELVMGEGEVRDQVRMNACKWKQLARDAVREGGSSHTNLKAFVNQITTAKA